MCGRYVLDDDLRVDALLAAILEINRSGALPAFPEGDVTPGMSAPALLAKNGKRVCESLRWGFERSGDRPVINARRETAWEKPMFRGSAQAMRCLLPASGYYEWRERDKLRHRVDRPGGMLLLAGLWRADGRFVILTEPSRGALAELHPRMPVALWDADLCRGWLRDEGAAREILMSGTRDGLRATPEGPEQLSMVF